MFKKIVWIVVLILLVGSVSATVVDPEVFDSLKDNDDVSVIVILKDQSLPSAKNLGVSSAEISPLLNTLLSYLSEKETIFFGFRTNGSILNKETKIHGKK